MIPAWHWWSHCIIPAKHGNKLQVRTISQVYPWPLFIRLSSRYTFCSFSPQVWKPLFFSFWLPKLHLKGTGYLYGRSPQAQYSIERGNRGRIFFVESISSCLLDTDTVSVYSCSCHRRVSIWVCVLSRQQHPKEAQWFYTEQIGNLEVLGSYFLTLLSDQSSNFNFYPLLLTYLSLLSHLLRMEQ